MYSGYFKLFNLFLNFIFFIKVSNLFILSLSVSDFLIGLLVMPLSGISILFDRWITWIQDSVKRNESINNSKKPSKNEISQLNESNKDIKNPFDFKT